MAISGLFFFIFVSSTVNSKYVQILPMTGFEPQTSGVGSNRTANWGTSTFNS